MKRIGNRTLLLLYRLLRLLLAPALILAPALVQRKAR